MGDAITDSQDRHKQHVSAKDRSCTEIYEVEDQVLLNAKKLPMNVVSAIFTKNLRPHFIVSFTVVAKKGLAYTLNLSRKLRTHPVFYVGMLEPYRNSSHVDVEALAPRKPAVPQDVTSGSRHLTAPPFEAAAVPEPAEVSAPL